MVKCVNIYMAQKDSNIIVRRVDLAISAIAIPDFFRNSPVGRKK